MAANVIDRTALRQGAAVSLLFAVPPSLLARFLDDDSGSGSARGLLWLVALGGFTLGAGVAAWIQRTGYPLLHGLVCAGATYLAAQVVFVAIKVVRGGDVNWFGIMFTLSVVMVAGLVGGALGSMLQRRGIMPSARRPR